MDRQSSLRPDRTTLSPAARLVALLLCFAAMVTDGFNLAVMPLTMPAIAHEWRLSDTHAFGPIFSASVLGIMIGAPVLGGVADRFGRKKTFICSLLFFGFSSLLAMHVSTVPQLAASRLVTGLGIGGALPLGIVISAELTPSLWRARVIAVVSTGATAGAALSGFAASWLLPSAGWRSLFVIAGAAPIVFGIAAIFALPESAAHLRRLAGKQTDSAGAMREQTRVRELFHGAFAHLTLLLWLLFLIVGLANYFIQSWAPTLYAADGYRTSDIALALGLFGSFGALGGMLIGWPVDRFGVPPVVVLFLLAVPVLGALATMHASRPYLMVLMAIAGLLLFSLQVAINGIATQIYPAATRAKGVGWGMGSVRLGQLLGASGGGLLVGTGMGLWPLFWLLAALASMGMVASALLNRSFRTLQRQQ